MKDDKRVQEAKKCLRQRAALFGLQQAPGIDDKGDCQFDVVADQLRRVGRQESKDSVRAQSVAWIRANAARDLGHGTTLKEWVEVSYGSFEDYLRKTSQPQCWGDEVTLLAILEVYQVSIVIVSSTEGDKNWYRTYYPCGKGPSDELPCLWLGHELERHYWSLVHTCVGDEQMILKIGDALQQQNGKSNEKWNVKKQLQLDH